MNSAVGLVVIWPVARRRGGPSIDRVLADLKSRFTILAQIDRVWPARSADLNYERFYCDRPYSGRTLRRIKGSGSFTIVVIQDSQAHFDYRETAQGVELVNTNFFDAKWRYREWLGREHAIHMSDHEREGSRDIALMLGPDALAKIRSDEGLETVTFVDELWGAPGWKTVKEALSLLNRAARYVVLNDPIDTHRLSVLTDDYLATVRALNAVNDSSIIPRWGGLFSMPVDGVQAEVEVRFVGDEYLPAGLARNLLDRRVILDGVYVPSKTDIELLSHYARKAGLEVGRFSHETIGIISEAVGELRADGTGVEIVPTVPRDLTVAFDFRRAGHSVPLLRTATRGLRRVAYLWRRRAYVSYTAALHGITDTYPVLGRIRRRLFKLVRRRRRRFATKITLK